jgi:UDP-4-amino-4,6-dideoxy-N-acetyl-beta-L-altrosamine transaminase
MISYGKQSIDQSDIDSVVSVLKSDFLTQGNQVPLFEKSLTEYTGANYGVAVNSGTSALHIACLALGVGQGDIVWVPAISFVASANCALYCGADIDFVDVDSMSGNIDIEALSDKLKKTDRNKIPKVIVVVHMAGNPCDLETICNLVRPFNIKIIEDASHALGAEYKSKKIGSCEFSDISTLSFHPVKIITTGEGGMSLTNSKSLSDKMRLLASHGITKDKNIMTLDDPWCYEQHALGYNYRMSDIQAALGVNQIKRIDSFIENRKKIAKKYDQAINSKKITQVKQNKEGSSSYHLYTVKVDPKLRKELYEYLNKNDIGSQVHYYPIPLQPYYKNLGFKQGDYVGAENYYSHTLSIPIYPTMSESQIEKVVGALNEF